jgi:hypothetical protein
MDMRIAAPNNLENLVHVSRRGLWAAFVIIVVFGAAGLVLLCARDTPAARMATGLMTMLPLAIAVALGGMAMKAKAKGVSMSPSNPALRAIRNDELRQASLHKAWRNGFLALLVAQPLMSVLLTALPAAYPMAVMGLAACLTGATVFLASLLYYDR